MGRLFIRYLETDKVYLCIQCNIHLAECSLLVSRVNLLDIYIYIYIYIDISWPAWKSLSLS